jgi:AraC-like DNA-binding protein
MAGTMSLADIAYGVGYPDQTTFTRAFARRFGKPPGWRAAALA